MEITERVDNGLSKTLCWLIHENRPDELCFMEGIFKDPTLNDPCPARLEVEKRKAHIDLNSR